MTDLSPQAQAVLDAYSNASDGEYVEGVWVVYERTMLAAALRAAADQVAPPRPVLDSCCEHFEQAIRHKILAIAAELDPPTS